MISVGALLLGVMFGQLTRRIPATDGGLYAYSRHEFGDFAGYLTAWCYWITCWAGNAAIVASWVLYVKSFTMEAWGWTYPANNNWPLFAIAMAGLWIPAVINLFGTRSMAWFQNITVVLKFLPLLFIGLFAWFFVAFASSNYPAFNTSGGSLDDRGVHRRGGGAVLLHRGGGHLDRHVARFVTRARTSGVRPSSAPRCARCCTCW